MKRAHSSSDRRGAVSVACGVVALVVSPVHNGHVRRGEFLAVVGLEHRQLRVGDQAADVVNRVQHALLIVCVEQIVENGACHDGKPVLFQLICDQLGIDGQVAVGAKLDGAVTGLCRLPPARVSRAVNTDSWGRPHPSSRVHHRFECS